MPSRILSSGRALLRDDETRARVFEALAHPTRIKILRLVEDRQRSFAELKHELGLESSGHLQHHLGKLSGLVSEGEGGRYGPTNLGKQALWIATESERPGRSLESLCWPVLAKEPVVTETGGWARLARFAAGGVFLALTVYFVAAYTISGYPYARLSVLTISHTFGVWIATLYGFLGVSSILAGIKGYAGCEVTAIPNLLLGRRYYLSCSLAAPFTWLEKAVRKGSGERVSRRTRLRGPTH